MIWSVSVFALHLIGFSLYSELVCFVLQSFRISSFDPSFSRNKNFGVAFESFLESL